MLDAVVIGGGFYGVAIALYLRQVRGMRNIALLEREPSLMARASYNNQARIHNGYHYPRSFQTAYRSRVNLPRFLLDFPSCVHRDFTHLYAIARHASKVSAQHFSRFCHEIGAPLVPASHDEEAFFDTRVVERVFRVEEMAFDASLLRDWASESLARQKIQVFLGTHVAAVRSAEIEGTGVDVFTNAQLGDRRFQARHVFNCAYSGIGDFDGFRQSVAASLKHEIAELALVQVPRALKGYGVTVMDGPFFSLMPFPARGLHTLSHVRYTPHMGWPETGVTSAYDRLDAYHKQTRFDRMQRDAARFLPAIKGLEYVESLFEVKTVLIKNEADDGRPILFERHPSLSGCYTVLGGKIDNIYDIIRRLDDEPLGVSLTGAAG